MRLNWFSPLAPARSDVAGFTTRLIPSLRAYADVTLCTDQADVDASLERQCRVRHFDAQRVCWPELHEADLNIYNIGNNSEFHSGIWEVSRQAPGIVILHDICLQHLFAGYYLQMRKDRATYIAHMARHYGQAGRHVAESFAAGASSTDSLSLTFPLTDPALENALGIVVHTRPAFESISRASNRPVLYTPLPYQPASVQTRHEWAQSSRTLLPYKVVVLGYLGPNRRLEPILRALGGLPERNKFHLSIYGTVWDPEYIRKLIRSCDLDSLVEVHGYVEDLDNELADADLALNLRYPTMGEASGTQLRLWDHAIPTMVTKTGWYATLPDDAVLFVRPDNEIEDIQAGLRRFLRDPAAMATLGAKGQQILDTEHTPEQYAASLMALVPAALREYSWTAALSLAGRVGADLKRWAPAYTDGPWLDDLTETIASLAGTHRSGKDKAGGAPVASALPVQPNTNMFTIQLEYPIHSRPRYGYGLPRHALLYNILNGRRRHYAELLSSFQQYACSLLPIAVEPTDAKPNEPYWNNGFLPGTDVLCLYALLCQKNPARYFEIGSGHSTRFARHAIHHHSLSTRITAIDPTPRCEITAICDKLIERPLEDVNPAIFDQLTSGDILFCDNSHRVLMNSDVTVFFLDVLPRLQPGVFVHLHDIHLPDDYPPEWIERYYSEQYMLACHLLADTARFDVLLPNHFISTDPELQQIVTDIWRGANLPPVEVHGESFWIETK